MRLKTFKEIFKTRLSNDYRSTEIDSLFNLLLKDYLGMTRLNLALNPETTLNSAQKNKFEQALDRLKKHEPIQYILGKTEFYGLEFEVNQNVLIPRPETEELVQWILEEYPAPADISILDIGTGSGCIPIALAKNRPQAVVSAVDISQAALKVAQTNARKNKVLVDFQHLDILSTAPLHKTVDVIVANPPYVRHLEKEHMAKNVLDYEPHLALFVSDKDPLVFYRKILEFAKTHLSKTGSLYFEVNEFLKDDLATLFNDNQWPRVTFKTDGFGKLRMVRVKR